MTSEQFIEELLFEAHQKGIFDELMHRINDLKKTNPYLNRYEAYEEAYNKILAEKKLAESKQL